VQLWWIIVLIAAVKFHLKIKLYQFPVQIHQQRLQKSQEYEIKVNLLWSAALTIDSD